MAKIRVFIADDHALLRSGMRLLIDAQDDMEVVGEAGNAMQTKRELASVQPDVLMLDLSMPGGGGMATISAIRRAFPEINILVVTMHDDPAHVRAALAMGAAGYVVKSAADSELISAIRAVDEGRVFVDAHFSAGNSSPMSDVSRSREASANAPIDALSMREREVLMIIAQGHTNQAAADQLGLSVKTVESYRARLMDKLGLANRADLVRLATESGLLGANLGQKPS